MQVKSPFYEALSLLHIAYQYVHLSNLHISKWKYLFYTFLLRNKTKRLINISEFSSYLSLKVSPIGVKESCNQ